MRAETTYMQGRQKVYKSGVARIVLRIKLIIIDSALARMRTINSWAELLDLFGSAQSSHWFQCIQSMRGLIGAETAILQSHCYKLVAFRMWYGIAYAP